MKTAIPPESGAQSGAQSAPAAVLADAAAPASDPDLARLLAAWPRLPGDTRREILRLAELAAR